MIDRERQIKMRIGWFRHVEEITGNVAKIWMYYGISKKTYYKRHNRYLKDGEDGLIERFRRPIHFPKATPPKVIEKIVYLR
ncbi:MAG: leucine zipper domain-containing protein [bacterium]|nr:leucine zipper domain-containing protein [bacterium]